MFFLGCREAVTGHRSVLLHLVLFLLAGLCFHITQSRLGIVAILVLFAE